MSGPKLKGELWSAVLRVVLVSVNLFVLLLCLAVFVTGLWGRLVERTYLELSGEASLTRTSLAVAVVGACTALLTLLGILGSLLLKSIWGRVVLSVYAFVLVFMVVAEVAAGVAAIQYRNNLETWRKSGTKAENSTFDSLKRAYSDLNDTRWNEWDRFQSHMKCCGALNYSDYRRIFSEYVVPRSCCTHSAKHTGRCPHRLKSLNETDAVEDIHTEPCLDVIVDNLHTVMLELAIVVIVIGASQIVGVVASAIAIFATARSEERKSHSYKRLQQTTKESSEYCST